jgi:hypothetical protein
MRSTIVPGVRQRGLAHPPTSAAQSFLTATEEYRNVTAAWLAKGAHCSQARKSAMLVHRTLAICLGMIFSENRSHFSGSCPDALEIREEGQ